MKKLVANLVVLGVAVLGMTGVAHGVVIDDFESYQGGGADLNADATGINDWVTTDLFQQDGTPPITSLHSTSGAGFTGQRVQYFSVSDGGSAVDLGVSLGNGSTASVLTLAIAQGGEVHFAVTTSAVTDGTTLNEPAYMIKASPDFRVGFEGLSFSIVSFDGVGNSNQVNLGMFAGMELNDWIDMRITVQTGGNGITDGFAEVRNATTASGWTNIGTFDTIAAGFGTGNTYASLSTFNAAAFDNLDVNNVPEPASLALLGLGGLMMLRRRR